MFAIGLVTLASKNVSAQSTGTVSGIVRTEKARVANARVTLDTAREERSDSLGRFEFRDVPAGRHTVEVRSLGALPVKLDVIVVAGEKLDFEIQVEKIVTLDSMRVEGSTVRQGFVQAYADRKRLGLGKYMDSAEVKKFAQIRQALLFVPGIRCQRKCDSVYFSTPIGLCAPNIWIDMENWGTDQGVLMTMRPDDVMAVEAYTRDALIPNEFQPRGRERGCGALVIWTRRFWPEGKGKPPTQSKQPDNESRIGFDQIRSDLS